MATIEAQRVAVSGSASERPTRTAGRHIGSVLRRSMTPSLRSVLIRFAASVPPRCPRRVHRSSAGKPRTLPASPGQPARDRAARLRRAQPRRGKRSPSTSGTPSTTSCRQPQSQLRDRRQPGRMVRQAPAAPLATSPMIAASSCGRDHIGQWLVGRSTQVTSRSSAKPPSHA
jgi:hypothetical protein